MISKIKPKSGFSNLFHIALNLLLPVLVFMFVRMGFTSLAVAAVLLSKWRMFAVRPRHWLANMRSNSVDIIVGLSLVIFMAQSFSVGMQLLWVLAYALWLVFLKPGSSIVQVSLQAMVAQLLGLMAIFLEWGSAPLAVLVVLTWLVCYLSARHFFSSFDEEHTSLFSHTWGYFGAALTWVLGQWLLFYGLIAMPTLLLTVTGYGLAALYYLDHHDKLTTLLRRQFIFMMFAVLVVVIVFSDWGDRAL